MILHAFTMQSFTNWPSTNGIDDLAIISLMTKLAFTESSLDLLICVKKVSLLRKRRLLLLDFFFMILTRQYIKLFSMRPVMSAHIVLLGHPDRLQTNETIDFIADLCHKI